jgi:hypothetical protein
MNKKLVLYTYSSDWKIEDHGGVQDGANPNMPHTFVVKESHNMANFMPGDEFQIDRDMYPEYFYKKIGVCDFVLVYPRGAKNDN